MFLVVNNLFVILFFGISYSIGEDESECSNVGQGESKCSHVFFFFKSDTFVLPLIFSYYIYNIIFRYTISLCNVYAKHNLKASRKLKHGNYEN